MGKLLEQIQFRDWVERHVPIIETLHNAGGVYEKVLDQLLTVLGGDSAGVIDLSPSQR